MAIRLKDIARELKLSVITVSKAMRSDSDISEATRERVLACMKRLDYQPNMAARALATGSSSTLGLIVSDLVNPFFAELAKSLGGALRKESYGLVLASSEDDPEIERSEIRMMLARGVDALLLASCQPTLDGFLPVHNPGLPFVLLDRPYPHLRANFVGSDDYAGGRLAAEHLIQVGRTRLAYIGSPDLGPEADRYRGFRVTLRDRDIELREDLVLPSPNADKPGSSVGYDLMRTLLKNKSKPNGVFCHNDLVAIGAIKATLDAGLTIPGDIAFIGFDNLKYAEYLQIPLTSVDQCTSKLGEAAAELALDLVAKRVDKPKNVLLAPTLVVRESTVGNAATARELTMNTEPSGISIAKPAQLKRRIKR